MLIQNVAALTGSDLRYQESIDIRIKNGRFEDISHGMPPGPDEDTIDCSGMLMVPGFINCHTHIGDSIAKDAASGMGLEASIHPVYGIKARVLERTHPPHLADFMRMACRGMLSRGITTFVDFREGGAAGAALLRKACRNMPIRDIILGRAKTQNDMDHIMRYCDGVGISGANEHTDEELEAYSQVSGIRAIHAAESRQTVQKSKDMTGRGEVERALQAKPDFLVHMGAATDAEMHSVPPQTGIVVCPRSNAVLSGEIPDMPRMIRHAPVLALGTDNVMINHPDMFREMEFAWKATGCQISANNILAMATVNGGRILRMNIGAIKTGYAADYILIEKRHADMYPLHNPHVSLVQRASPDCIRAVAVGGRIVHGNV